MKPTRTSKAPTPVRLAIVHAGRTQRDIAAAIGMDEGQLSRIVNGLHADDATRERIARELGRKTEDLWPALSTEAAA